MVVEDFNYTLPEHLIAKTPSEKRDGCRLMVLDKVSGEVSHRQFYDVIDYMEEGDCLVLNNSKVIPARLFGSKEGTGAKVEFLLAKRKGEDTWESLVKPGKKLKVGDRFLIGDGELLKGKVVGMGEEGSRIVKFFYSGDFMTILDKIGRMPLPPYIDRSAKEWDKEAYQTVYSQVEGSIAAPTAGLHFTEELLQKTKEKGVKLAYVTLHVGIGTFRPVKVEKIEDHHMHFEEYEVSEEAADTINQAIISGHKIISVGTTSTRTVESVAKFNSKADKWLVESGSGATGIFIYPGYEYKVVDRLITNFHLPKSTLIMLVSAMAGREKVLEAYKKAVEEEYRFFSYGDAMIIK